MDARTSDPTKLIPAVNAAAREFDVEHENDAEYITVAANQANDFILWAWGVKAGQVMSARLMMDPKHSDLECFHFECHRSCIS
jgi:hypothetical protein